MPMFLHLLCHEIGVSGNTDVRQTHETARINLERRESLGLRRRDGRVAVLIGTYNREADGRKAKCALMAAAPENT
jgi:hypothetical protein